MGQTVRKTVLVVLGVIWLLPVYLMVVNAGKANADYGLTSPWQPTSLANLAKNAATAWDRGDLFDGVLSTLLYAIASPLIAVIIGAMAGFAIVALKLRHGFMWFTVIFSSTVLPIQMVLMPLFIGYVQFDLYDTRVGMILLYTVISVPFSAFVIRNFFTGISRNVFEAAVMDGASTWRIFWQIYIPLSRPALAAVFILQATFIWNDLLLGLTLTQSKDNRPIVTLLSGLQSTYGGSTMPVVLAGGLLVSLPTVILFLATQRSFTRGLALGQF